MSIIIADFRKHLEKQFDNSELLSNHVIRFTKKYVGRPYATYYIDFGGQLEEKANDLRQYQDKLLGPGYFSGPKSLQWNNYLFLVATINQLKKPEILDAKIRIERDRSYARKFVLSEEELKKFIDAPVAKASKDDPSANILSIWASKFRSIGAEEAVFSDDDLPTKIKYIEHSSANRTAKKALKPVRKNSEALSFIEHLELQNFRRAPIVRTFTFGKVNLIYGRNGTGKTSLFEAIEFFYCGRHKRNPEDATAAKWIIRARFFNGRDELGIDRPPSLFRQRNLEWYGQPEIKTNNLCQSFGRYNFFDTDAAVGFVFDGEEQAQLEENLSKLLVRHRKGETAEFCGFCWF